jgi:formylmethanofuran dehydrogenase subunit D
MEKRRKLKVTLITGRTIEQGVGKEHGKASDKYLESVAVCYLDPEDLKALGIKEKMNVQVSTKYGSVTVTALKSPARSHRGIIFIPYGLWANAVTHSETDSVGMPSLKGMPAEIEPAAETHVLDLKSLLTKQFGKE